jgi:ABC-type nitrate/sulfonate/bicarbonate transport system substrate-binding protein
VGQGSISLQSGLLHIAKDRGLFSKYGLVAETIYIPGGSTNIHVLISGNLDLFPAQRRTRCRRES